MMKHNLLMPGSLIKRLRLMLRYGASLPPLVDFCSPKYTLEQELMRYKSQKTCGHHYAIDLGCGSRPRNPFVAETIAGVDISEQVPTDGSLKEFKSADLTLEPIPFASDKFTFVTAFDFIEHVPRVVVVFNKQEKEHKGFSTSRLPFVELMNEIFRILKPGGLFLSVTPAWPFSDVFKDPTHVNYITWDTFPSYFCNNQDERYGFSGNFTLVRQGWLGYKLVSLLQKSEVYGVDKAAIRSSRPCPPSLPGL